MAVLAEGGVASGGDDGVDDTSEGRGDDTGETFSRHDTSPRFFQELA